MITEKERELGTRFAYINIVATLTNFIFLAFVIGPDEIGYNESFGSLLGLVGLAQGLSFLGIIRLSGKLFNAKDNPLLAGAVAVTYGVSIVGLMFSLTPTFIANGFSVRGISADTVTDLSFYLNFTQFLFGALWIANVVRADEGQLPSWGKTVGSIQAYGSAAVLFAFYFGVIGQPLFVPALALAGLAILDSLLSCKVADNLTNTRHSSDRETFGQGMANMAAGLFGGVTTATATMRTVANIKFGAKTPLASIVHGATLLAILLGLGSLVAIIPTACLAAILFKVGIEIMDYRILPFLRKLPTADLSIFTIVLVVTVFEDLMIAIAIGTVFALISSRNEIKSIFKSNPSKMISNLTETKYTLKSRDTKLEELPVKILKPNGPLFFGSVEPMIESYARTDEHEVLIVDLSTVSMVDVTGIYALEDLIKNSLKKNTEVFISEVDSKVEEILQGLNFLKDTPLSNFENSRQSINPILKQRYGLSYESKT